MTKNLRAFISTNNFFFIKMGHPRPLFHLFSVFFKQTIQFLQQINAKKCQVHPVSGAGITFILRIYFLILRPDREKLSAFECSFYSEDHFHHSDFDFIY